MAMSGPTSATFVDSDEVTTDQGQMTRSRAKLMEKLGSHSHRNVTFADSKARKSRAVSKGGKVSVIGAKIPAKT